MARSSRLPRCRATRLVGVEDHAGHRAAPDGHTRITGSETIDRLQVNTLGGNDTVEVDDDVAALIGVAVDLGPDQI